ncbi:MAG: hypothetical protein V3T30_02300, partial [Thermodesulfobacteriota bacterium]
FSFDTHPWILWGNSQRDTTTKQERLNGYVFDLDNGIRIALRSKEALKETQSEGWDNKGDIQALAFFIVAQEKMNTNSLFDLFDNSSGAITDEKMLKVLKDLEAGLDKAVTMPKS